MAWSFSLELVVIFEEFVEVGALFGLAEWFKAEEYTSCELIYSKNGEFWGNEFLKIENGGLLFQCCMDLEDFYRF